MASSQDTAVLREMLTSHSSLGLLHSNSRESFPSSAVARPRQAHEEVFQMAEVIKPRLSCEEGWWSGLEDRWTNVFSVLWGGGAGVGVGGSYLVSIHGHSVCRFCGSPALLAFIEKGSWQSGQEAILRCGETTPAVGFAITNCELGHSNSPFLPSSIR